MDLERLLRGVKGLVGELDFSFHVVGTYGEGRGGRGSEDTLVVGKRKSA